MDLVDPIVFRLTIFVLAIFVGYFVVWSVTPALHTPLMAVTNAISSVIVVGALIAVSVQALNKPDNVTVSVVSSTPNDIKLSVNVDGKPMSQSEFRSRMRAVVRAATEEIDNPGHALRMAWISKGLGFFALILASVNIFGGFLVTARMLAMYKKKAK